MVNGILDYLWLVPALPLLGVVLNGAIALFVERPYLLKEAGLPLAGGHGAHGHDAGHASHGTSSHGDSASHHEAPAYRKLVAFIAPAVVGAAFVVALLCVLSLASRPADGRTFVQILFPWIQAGSLLVPAALQLDPLSSVMALVVTGVGFLIHVYSVGYMSHERAFARYFVYLNLFMFAMLTLVLANNYLLMFVGWEGVGLCSYLLIGFWYEKQSASDAGKKAFIANRIGDFGVLLAMFLVFWTFGSLSYTEIFAKVPLLQESGILTTGLATAITLLLFLGATGKSAQIPLYVWLPDAMEGPTPVSALIHAATMVTAGVYMVARSSALFLLAPDTMMVVAVIGAVTAIFSATIGICQTDIKRVLAYSTVSQLGYMFLACGVGAFTAGIFHLMTHAFFKALLFLGSGSVIHALSGEQDMRKMGGLEKIRSGHLRHDVRRDAGDRGDPGAVGLLLQGRDPVAGVLVVPREPGPVGHRGARRGDHGVLHVPARLPHLLRRIPHGSRGGEARPRVPLDDDRAADDPRGPVRRRRVDRDPGRPGRQQPLRALAGAGLPPRRSRGRPWGGRGSRPRSGSAPLTPRRREPTIPRPSRSA